MEYYYAINRNEELIHITTWMNLQNVLSCEGSQTQKVTYSMIPLMRLAWNR